MATIKTENMSNSNLMLILLMVSLLSVGITALVGKTLGASIVRDNKVVTAKLAADKQLTTNLKTAPQLVEAYKNLGSTAGLLDDALPSTSDFPSVMVTLENMSKDAGFSLKSVTPAAVLDTGAVSSSSTPAPTSAAQAQTFDYTVNFVGTYDSLRKFYSDVETSIRPMRVTGMQLSGSGSALTGVIDMETYFQGSAAVPITTENIK